MLLFFRSFGYCLHYFPKYLFSSILPAVYSLFCSGVLDCTPAIHQGTAFHYLVQSVETEKSFWGGVALSSSTKSLKISLTGIPYFTLCTLCVKGFIKIIWTHFPWFSYNPIFTPGYREWRDFLLKQEFYSSSMIKRSICIHQLIMLILLHYSHSLDNQPDKKAQK